MEGQENKNTPTANQILSLLVDLLADQYGVKVQYNIVKKEGVKK